MALAERTDTVKALERELTAALRGDVAGVDGAEVLIVPATSEVRVFAEEITQREVAVRSRRLKRDRTGRAVKRASRGSR